jgi:hypothetical protein
MTSESLRAVEHAMESIDLATADLSSADYLAALEEIHADVEQKLLNAKDESASR